MLGLLDRKRIRDYVRGRDTRKLNLGCGRHPLDGWLNTDRKRRLKRVVKLDVTKPMPFEAGTFRYVLSEHLIEHLGHTDGLRMLAECHRILAPGGRLRISTPDLAFLFALHGDELSELQIRYLAWARETFVPDAPHAGAAFVTNNFFRDWGHRFLYDEPTLRRALEDAGFTDLARFEIGESEDPGLRGLEYEARMPEGFLALESMVFEGVKA